MLIHLRPMESELRQNLVAVSTEYCRKTDTALSTVAQAACGDWRFFDRLAKGASFTARTYDRALHWFSDRWPLGVEWPAGVHRPEPQPLTDPRPEPAGAAS